MLIFNPLWKIQNSTRLSALPREMCYLEVIGSVPTLTTYYAANISFKISHTQVHIVTCAICRASVARSDTDVVRLPRPSSSSTGNCSSVRLNWAEKKSREWLQNHHEAASSKSEP